MMTELNLYIISVFLKDIEIDNAKRIESIKNNDIKYDTSDDKSILLKFLVSIGNLQILCLLISVLNFTLLNGIKAIYIVYLV